MSKGLVAFPITPMDESGRIEADAFERLLDRLIEANVDGVCVLGSTGTYAFLAREERARALQIAAERLRGRVPLMAGIGALRTSDAVLLAQDAAAAGASLGLLAPMSYTPLTEDEVFKHFQTVAQERGVPVCVYDNPASTHFAISDDLMKRLSRLPNVVASKSAAPAPTESSARLMALRQITLSGFSVGFAVDWNAPAALTAGADAWYSVAGGLFPGPIMAIKDAAAAGDLIELARLEMIMQPLWDLMRVHSGIRVMYAAANWAGVCNAVPPRPILPLAPAVHTEVATMLDALQTSLRGPHSLR